MLAVWIIFGVVAGIVASGKGRSVPGWVLLSLLLSPLVILVLLTLPPLNARKCPHCAEITREEAMICPHCHSSLSSFETRPETRPYADR